MDIRVKKRLLWASLLSAFIMALLLLKVDWSHFSLIAGRIDILYFFLAFFLYFLANLMRSIRFCKIDHAGNKLSHWWSMNQIYNLVTATLPGVSGEAFTAYLLKRFSTFNMLSALRILFLSRLMDLTAYSAVLLFSAVLISGSTSYRKEAILISGFLFIASMIAAHPTVERFMIKLLQKISFNNRLINRACEKLEEVAVITESRFSASFFGITMIQSMLMIFFAALSAHYMLHSFGTGFTLLQSFYCFGVYALFQMVPIHGIAGIGTQAAWWTLALTVAGYKTSDVIAMGIFLYGTFYMIIAVLGLAAFAVWMMIREKDQTTQ